MTFPKTGSFGVFENPIVKSIYGSFEGEATPTSQLQFLLMDGTSFLLMDGTNFLTFTPSAFG